MASKCFRIPEEQDNGDSSERWLVRLRCAGRTLRPGCDCLRRPGYQIRYKRGLPETGLEPARPMRSPGPQPDFGRKRSTCSDVVIASQLLLCTGLE
jgi:hypothetical protein